MDVSKPLRDVLHNRANREKLEVQLTWHPTIRPTVHGSRPNIHHPQKPESGSQANRRLTWGPKFLTNKSRRTFFNPAQKIRTAPFSTLRVQCNECHPQNEHTAVMDTALVIPAGLQIR